MAPTYLPWMLNATCVSCLASFLEPSQPLVMHLKLNLTVRGGPGEYSPEPGISAHRFRTKGRVPGCSGRLTSRHLCLRRTRLVPLIPHRDSILWANLAIPLPSYNVLSISWKHAALSCIVLHIFGKDGELPDQVYVLGLELVGGLVAFYCDQWRE